MDIVLAAYENARADYDQLSSVDYPAAVAELAYQKSLKDQAEKEYRDAQTLYSEGAISQNDLSLKQIQMDSAYAQWSAASLRVLPMGPGNCKLLQLLEANSQRP